MTPRVIFPSNFMSLGVTENKVLLCGSDRYNIE